MKFWMTQASLKNAERAAKKGATHMTFTHRIDRSDDFHSEEFHTPDECYVRHPLTVRLAEGKPITPELLDDIIQELVVLREEGEWIDQTNQKLHEICSLLERRAATLALEAVRDRKVSSRRAGQASSG